MDMVIMVPGSPKKVSFPATKKMKIGKLKFPTENGFPDPFFLKILAFSVALRRKFCHTVLDSRDDQVDQPIKGSLPTNSTSTPDRLRWWARLSDDDFKVF